FLDFVPRLFQKGVHVAAPCGVPDPFDDPTFHIHGSPVFWRNDKEARVYLWGENDWLRAYDFEDGRFPLSREFLYPGPKVVFGNDFTRAAPALAAIGNNELAIAFTGTGGGPFGTNPGFVNVMRTRDGECFPEKSVLGPNNGNARSRQQPGIAFGNNVAVVV